MSQKILKVCGILLFTLLLFSTAAHAEEEAKAVEVTKAKRGSINKTIRLLGTIKPQHITILTAEVYGVVENLQHAGLKVKKGEIIAQLENTSLNNSLKLAENAAHIAKTSYDRANSLFNKGIVTKKDFEEAKLKLIYAQQKLSTARIEHDKTIFKAPFDGIVGAHKIRVGTHVQQGDIILTFYQPDDLLIEFDVPEPQVPYVNTGHKVLVHDKEFLIADFQRAVDPETHMAPATVHYQCDNCVIGSHTDVDLVIKELKDVIVIPYESVFVRAGQTHVYTVENDKVELKSVALGLRQKETVEVLDGLKEGELVILRGQGRLYPDAKVKIHEETKP